VAALRAGERTHDADDQERRVLRVLAVVERLLVSGFEVGPLALLLPGEEAALPDACACCHFWAKAAGVRVGWVVTLRVHRPRTVSIPANTSSSFGDEADPDARNVTALLDGIPGAFERAEHGLGEANAGLGTPLEDL